MLLCSATAALGVAFLTRRLSLLCWNVLAQNCLDRNNTEYTHVAPADKPWPTRVAAIIAEIVATKSDIVCLQEVRVRRQAQSGERRRCGHGE